MTKFKEPSNAQLMIDILKTVIIDLITGYSSPNNKLRTLSEEVLTQVFNLLNELKSLPQLFSLLLVGFAGTKAQTKSATIRALMLLLTINYKQQGLEIEDPSFQDFLRKVSKIVALYLRDGQAETEIHRASLRFLKTAIAFLTIEQLNQDILDSILSYGIFSLPPAKRGKHMALIRKLLGKLLKKLGTAAVKKVTPLRHQPLIDYIERARRKRTNKAKRVKLLALLGQDTAEAVPTQTKKPSAAAVDSESEDELESEDEHADIEEHFSDEDEGDSVDGESSSDEESEEEEVQGGTDHLMTDTIDIPRVDNIPVVSKLAKEKQIEQSGRTKLNQIEEQRQKVKQMMQAEQDEYESHFVENPFIRMRERTLQKNLDSKTRIGATQLRAVAGGALRKGDADMIDEEEAQKQDIVIVKETGKFIINDLEMPKVQPKKLKRSRVEAVKGDGMGSDNESSVGDNASVESSDDDNN